MGQRTRKTAARPPPLAAGPASISALALLALAVLGLAGPLSAQTPTGTVRGRVASFVTERPIDGARVTILGTDLEATTDPEGRFVLVDVPAGVRRFRVAFDDTVSDRLEVRVRAGRENEIEIRIDVDAVPLPELRVSVTPTSAGKLAGFYQRMERATGVFITREEIEDRDPVRTSDLFRAVPGVRVAGFGPGTSSVAVVRGPTPCPIEYFLDGMQVAGFEVDAVSPETIDGIEVYRGPAEVPPQFRRAFTCAAIVIWTRDPGR